jgi:hypothetical protein
MLAGALTMTSTAFAQFANSGKSSGGSSADIADYNRIGISYTNTNYSPNHSENLDGDDVDSFSLDGVSIDYIHGFAVSPTLPLFVETGIGFTYASTSEEYEDYYDYTDKINSFNLQVPVNLAYHVAIADDLTLAPYIGLNLKYGLSLKEKISYDVDDEYFEQYFNDIDTEESINLYDTGDDLSFKRFQIGWHIGVGLQYQKVYLGLQYGTDFTPVLKDGKFKLNTSDFKVSLAYCF